LSDKIRLQEEPSVDSCPRQESRAKHQAGISERKQVWNILMEMSISWGMGQMGRHLAAGRDQK
jgi:hypothetical protein